MFLNSSLRRQLPALLSACALLGLGVSARAQSNWVDWADDTANRLQLSTVTVNDSQEKDVEPADLDNDGDTDLVIARKVPFSNPGGRTDVLLMNEGGVLVDRTATLIPDFLTPDDARDIRAFDADGDGWLDIVTANTFTEQPRLFMNQGRDANGVFQGWVEEANWFSPLFVPGPMFCAVTNGDVNGDGFDDLFFSDYNNSLEDRLLINDGTGHFTDETDLRLAPGMKTSAFGTGCKIADFNGDGWGDILKITTLFAPKKLRLLLNDGTGFFQIKQELNYNEVYMIDAADYNNDGRLDIYVESDNQDYQLINNSTNPDGTINTTKVLVSGSSKTNGFGGNVHHGDLNRDGYEDTGVADVDVDIPGCTRRFTALINKMPATGANGLKDPNNTMTLPWNSQGNHDFAWIDINGDGFLDLFQARCAGYSVFMMQPFAVAERHGAGCVGSNGVPSIGATGVPSLGNASFDVTLTDGASNAVPWLVISDRPGPIVTGSGCVLEFELPANLFPAPGTDGTGATTLALPVPNDPILEGLRLFTQWAIPDPAGPFGAGFSFSDGLELYVSGNALP